MLQVVATHGRDNPFGNELAMEDEFKKAFQFGLKSAGVAYYDQVPFSFGFYGDLWRPDRRKEWEARKGTRAFRAAEAEADLIGMSIAEDILRNGGLLEKIAIAPGNKDFWSGLTHLLAALDRFTPGIAGAALLQRLAADTGEYLSNETLRGLTIDHISGKVEAAKGEVLLLAHSMGTIVCYDMLMRYPGLPVRAYISFGSPLGMRAIMSTVDSWRQAKRPVPAKATPLDQCLQPGRLGRFCTVARASIQIRGRTPGGRPRYGPDAVPYDYGPDEGAQSVGLP
ncbi:MAG TPA: hypothetical protein VF952_20610 [Chloroflexia bacterium]|jgi:hypothetical protein